jgi:hypothetical protein
MMAASASAPHGALLLAETEYNRSHKRCAVCSEDAVSFCARCRLTPYCSAICQRAHFPRHKAVCVAHAPPPAGRDGVALARTLATRLEAAGALPDDWRAPYRFVLIRPGPDAELLEDTVAAVVGVPEELRALRLSGEGEGGGAGEGGAGDGGSAGDGGGAGDGADEAAIAELNARCSWARGGGAPCLVRGFSTEDRCSLRAWTSGASEAALPANSLGAAFAMRERCRGGVLVQKVDFAAGEAPLAVSRREVWEIATARAYCGAAGLLTPRLVRENMRRKEAAAGIRETPTMVL